MHISAHLIAAAAAGRRLPHLWLAFLIGILGHVVLDMAPQPKSQDWIGNWDAIILVAGMVLAFRVSKEQRRAAIACGLGCMLPDMEAALIYLMPSVYPARLFPTHTGLIRQWEPPVPWGQIVQTLVILAGLWILWRSGRKARPGSVNNPGHESKN